MRMSEVTTPPHRGTIALLLGDPATAERARAELTIAGYRTLLIDNPVSVHFVVGRERPDFVVLDLGLSMVNGRELARRIDGAPVLLYGDLVGEPQDLLAYTGALGHIPPDPVLSFATLLRRALR